jgi:hypothetical protein
MLVASFLDGIYDTGFHQLSQFFATCHDLG